jgi:ligand-binding sensor domain-containing protein/AraC-like DNA-binding protein
LDPDIPIDQYLVDKWDISDGIPYNTIDTMVQTPDGYLWIATDKGLVRFDGITFSSVHFTGGAGIDPPKKIIPEELFVDREGTLWIGSPAGLTSYRHQTRRFQTFTTADGITGDNVRCIQDDMKGNLWISFYSSYVNRFFNGEFTAFNASHGLEGKKINAIVEGPNGNLYFGSFEKGVFLYKAQTFFKYPIPGLDKLRINVMLVDWKGDLWIGTDKGLLRVSGKKTVTYTMSDGLSNNYITYIIEDSDRNLWVATKKGLDRVKRKPGGAFDIECVLKNLFTVYLFEDREKSLWVGTFDSGIRRLKEGKFVSYAPLEAHIGETLFSLFRDGRGDTWVGAFDGKLFRCRDDELIESLQLPGLSGAGIFAIAQDAQGNLWLGTNGKGVFLKKNNTYIQFTTGHGLADNVVTSIFRDGRDNLWFSTFSGVSFISAADIGGLSTGRKITIRSLTSMEGLTGNRVHTVHEDRNGDVWIAADKGITVLKDGKIDSENVRHYLDGVSVTWIYEDPYVSTGGSKEGEGDRVYWIATHGNGLKRLTLRDGLVTSIDTYSTTDGMGSDFIYRFFEDQQGNFWMISDSGILRAAKNELARFSNRGADYKGPTDRINCTSLGIADGLKSLEFENEFSRNSAFQTGDGEIWFITRKGISIVNPAKAHINKIPPPVVIETVIHDPRSRSRLFNFTAPTFISPEKVRFKYKLEGFDGQWRFLPPGGERTARYENPGPGTYTFRVTACNSEGVWNRTGDSVTFTVTPFYYQTFLFKVAVFFVLIALAGVGYYIYKKRPFERKGKYKGPAPNPQFVDECVKKLTYLMEIEKIYRNPDISLPSLAEKISVTPHLLSYILNERLNRNFPDFINSYRIEEAREIFEGRGGEREKIEFVAADVGFKTIMAFYNAFKKFTKMTPARYKKKVKSKK